MYISIGSSCVVAQRLRMQGLQTNESHLFDWLISDIDSVANVLACDTLKTFKDKLISSEWGNETFEGNHVIKCNNLGNFRSMHDVPAKMNDIQPFIDKYMRRYIRLKEVIAKTSDITFIYWLQKNDILHETQVNRLFEILQVLHPKNEFKLTVLFEGSEHKHIDTTHDITFIYVNDYMKHPNFANDWTQPHLDWDAIFELL